jgi:hypothetical protein
MYAEWMLAPSGYYIGLLKVGNKHYYASGRTADHLERNMKFSAYQNERISASQVHLAHEKSDSIDISKASKMFYSKYIKAKEGTGTKTIVTKTHVVNEPKPVFEHITEIDKDTGELVVYKLIEVSRFKLRKTELENKPTTHTIHVSTANEVLLNNEIDAE